MARRKLWIDGETKNKNLSGKTYIVTGANSGVGFETSRQLIKQGAHVVMACRRVEVGQAVAKEFDLLKGSYKVLRLDLADLSSVRSFVDTFLSEYDQLHGLDCNAGMVSMGREVTRTKDGFEMSIGVSYFGHFLLTELLLDILKKTAPSRIVILSSCVHAGRPDQRPNVHLDDLNYRTRDFNAMNAYAEAKVANALYALELSRRLEGTGVTAFSVHPGWARSNFGKENVFMRVISPIMAPFIRSMTDSNEESAQTSLHCLISDQAVNHSGAYFSQSSVLYRDKACKEGGWPLTSPNPHAKDLNLAKKLVKETYSLVGLK
ncbi:SDR family NAD(P)-dependent oxidoreductase [Acidaminobacter sp. JC074]|uniref:SDR family NAD(P)-dependent oxidoreductase n=1 Tax=Acidaminobacter sp. JC074 TaxID=2530199 RepID=UPI001F107D35|nr:SDR family NAD(P)-dependent oxidoreductase [Acidaminobacter sp. JC074]MCH4889553.1 SDR family NAD(P)-dependent oxidoreductase [Acidaminobacter sp. JC074]